MRKFLIALSALLLCAGAAFALSADDFIPPVQAESKAEQEKLLKDNKPEAELEVKHDGNLGLEVAEFKGSSGVSLQDAVNKIIAKPKTGCQVVRGEGQGPTLVATGMGTYSLNYENIMAQRIEQRNAYVIAFMRAKDEMARTLSGISFEGASYFEQGSQSQSNSFKTLNNINTSLSERLKQWAQAVLKGYVTYAVQDDGKGRVYVTIVSSPKTRGQFDRNGLEGISAATLREGLDSVIAEIKKGLVPPVGGRIVEANTGEVAWVGFGSAIVRLDDEPDVQAELELQAEQIAGLRAVDGLAGIILGDETKWQAHVDEDTNRMIKSFEAAQKNDPIVKGFKSVKGLNGASKEYENRVREMRNAIVHSEKVESIRNGILPPGIMRQTELDDDGYFAYGIAVYLPSASDMAAQVNKEMKNTKIVREANPDAFNNNNNNNNNNEKIQGITPQKADPNKVQEMKRGPSGVVQQNL